MFFYPEPEPIGNCITDVSPSYLTDGIFFTGRKAGPTHKRVAKQLSAIPRGSTDPVSQLAKINPRTLDRWVEKGKAWHVDNCGRNAKALHSMMKLMPEENIDPYLGWKSKVSIFPRSEQYEYRYIRKSRIDEAKRNQLDEEEEEEEEEMKLFACLDQRGKNRSSEEFDNESKFHCSIGNPNDYGYEVPSVVESEPEDPVAAATYIPQNCITGEEHREDSEENKEIEKNGDKIEMRINRPGKGEGEGEADADADPHKSSSSLCRRAVDVRDKSYAKEKKNWYAEEESHDVEKLDPRWNTRREACEGVRINEYERHKRDMSKVLRPYGHEICTWYSVNKPTKIQPLILDEGKRSKPEWHFSNL